jgi:hypothetical protein
MFVSSNRSICGSKLPSYSFNRKNCSMKLSAPTQPIFIIAVILAIIAVLLFLNIVSFVAIPSFWVMTVAFVVLALGNLLRGM